MAQFMTYRLKFRSPVRIGERGVGLEATRPYIPADTLFSAICCAWRELYSDSDLIKEILDRFYPRSPMLGVEPFFLTSAFPYASSVRFFPKPLAIKNLRIDENSVKAFRRIRFISEAILNKLITGEVITFGKKSYSNDGNVWLDLARSPNDAKTLEEQALSLFWEPDQNDYFFWRIMTRPRVTLDRIASSSMIWHIGSVHFKEECGLWFAVDFRTTADAAFQQRFEACLRFLGDTGLGSERGGGFGLFKFCRSFENLPSAGQAKDFVTLAPFCPKNEQELEKLTADAPAYELITRRGWISSSEGSALRRKTIWMFSEGSVFSNPDLQYPGTMVDVTPDIWKEGAVPQIKRHDVFRYGYAFPIGIRR
jgi:CRISPR-associated protein Csm4